MLFLIERNISFCKYRYRLSLSDIFSGAFARIICEYVRNAPDVSVVASAAGQTKRWCAIDLSHDQLTLNTDDNP
jgi:hypothetical protein